jgi:hypothetical protein
MQQQVSSEKEKQYLRFILKIFLCPRNDWIYDNFWSEVQHPNQFHI